ncbi:hypothetical protein G4228_001649 [Cervus hanglu yarkandensis]|nr:hypothetical protein G4228_001649 [Cervus hanglu yarkandensis]
MASGSSQGCEEDEESLKKLIVRLNNVQEGKQIETLVQILEDMLVFTYADHASKLFQDKNVHVPLLIVLDSYMRVASVQQVGWSLLCKLIEICPNTMQSLMGPHDIGHDWEVLGVHQLILKMLTVHNASVNLTTVGLKALDLLLTSGSKISLLILDEENDIFLLIFDAMRTFSASDEVQKLGCKVLHVLFERVSEEQLTEFVENKDYMILLSALKNFEDEEEIVLHVLHCLHSLAIPCSNVEVLMSGNVRCYNIVVEAMKAFPISEKIQEVSCCLLHRLTLGNFFNILVLNEVHEFVVKAVQRYSENAVLQIAALSCLALLTETIFLNQDLEEKNENQENDDDEEEEKLFWLEACYKALTWHRKNKHVQEAACWALNNLLMYQNSLHEKIGDEDGQFPAHREVMLSMLMHSSSKEVFQASANALSTLLEQNVNFRKILLSKGIYLNVLELMQKHMHSPEVAESGCKMLNHLFEESSTSLDTMAAVVPKIITVMKSHETSLSVQLEALRALLHFIVPGIPEEYREDTEYQHKLNMIEKQCFRNDIHKLVLAALNRFIGNPGIQKCGLKVISSITHFPDALEVLSLEGAIDSVLHTLQMYPDDQEIQCLGLSLIGCLITKKNLCTVTGYLLAKILISTLQRFKDVGEVQIKGFQTVLTILELSVSFSKLLVHHSFDSVIFHQLSSSIMEQKDQQFLNLCCKCFAKLTIDNELKSVLLEKACDQNNSIMVECLLLLGADANRAKEATSLICQVCEKASNPKLVELLLNSGSREQDVRKALTISIGKGNSQIISLLLRRLALDLANNSICLGGFCMGKIEPSWLGPLFPDKTSYLRKETNIGSTLARMVLRYQMKSSVEEGAGSGSNGNFSEEMVDKFDEWTFIPESYIDSVFGQSDDLDSEGSEGSFLVKKKSNSISVGEFYRDPALQRCSPNLQRHSSSLTLKCLTHLDLHSNKFTSFPTYLLKMNCIANLDVSRNDIGPSVVLDPAVTCPTLKQFNLSYNQISSLPANLGDVVEKLEQLVLEGLRSLDMSSNDIRYLPGPVHWRSLNLRELLFSHNQISILDLSEKACAWSRIEKLHLSHNKLKEIPPEIGCLENLTSLDVSYNLELRSFPNEMGKLSKIWDLPLDELHLNFDFKHVGCKAKDIIRFLQQRLKKAVPYNRMKLMIVGNTGSGKTTLLQQLMKIKKSDLGMQGATVGIDVKDWPIQIRGKGKKDLILNVWDFAGREEFYSTHPHFMTQRALYLAVYDLSKGQAEVDAMKPWLFNIKARASSSPVILVGTHLDVTDEKQRKACISKITKELLNKRGFPAIRDYHFVNATEESDALAKLRKTIINESLNFKIRDQSVVGQLIPDCYVELEKIILSERKNVPIEFPVIDRKRLLQLVREHQLQLDENELPHAVHFLNESGVLLHFQDPALQLSDLYFVEPKWLCKVMAQILTVKVEGFPKHPKGIISRRDVEKFLSKKKRFPKNYMAQYFKLLEKFQIALPIGEEYLLVPSSLSDHRPVIELPHCENSEIIIRLYEMPYFPMGFWSRLINRLLEISPYMLSGRERALRPNRMYWRQGIYLNWSPEAYCLVGSEVLDHHAESFLKITVPSCRKGCVLLGQVVDHIDSLMEEWFPGLLEIDICGEGETLLKKWALYSFNDGEEHQKILLDNLMKKAEEGDLLVNPDQPRLTIPISQIAPDLILADLPRNIMLNNDELEFEQAPEFLLGDGSFGSVYRAAYKGEEVAVKIFNKHTSLRLLRQELVVLCHLHHPSLISLLAAGIRPRMLVMELASKGSLDRLLQQDKTSLTRTLQHRIVLHVADGLRYLHSAMIIYRDLKPHNVLLFTLYPNAAIIAKIADYGIAQYCCRMGIKTSEGTPGFRAPEVARGNVIYNQQADVYSFGLLLYDILTTGGRIAEGLKFPNEFDELAIQGKLPDPVKEYGCAPWPMVEKLIKKCLKENPQERPTSAQVFDILNSAELICLMRRISVPKSFTVECMVAMNHNSKNVRIWLGCGHTDKGQLSCLDLNTERYTPEEVTDSRILCLALVYLPVEKESWIVSGTQSGMLLVINTEDGRKRHTLEKMTDSVTCLYCNSFSKQSKQKNFLLVGTADGNLAIFEDKTVKCKGATPLKILNIGNVSTPLMCLSESVNLTEKNIMWGGCGTKVFSFSDDFTIQKLIETRTNQRFSNTSFSDSNIIAVVVDTVLYVAKKNSPCVEVWDKKTEKRCELIDCVHFLNLKNVMLVLGYNRKSAEVGTGSFGWEVGAGRDNAASAFGPPGSSSFGDSSFSSKTVEGDQVARSGRSISSDLGDTSLRSGDTFVGDSSGNLEPGLGSSGQQGLKIDELERDSLSGSASVGAGFKDLGSDASSSESFGWEVGAGRVNDAFGFGASGSSSFGDSDFSSKTAEGNRVVRSEGSTSSDLGGNVWSSNSGSGEGNKGAAGLGVGTSGPNISDETGVSGTEKGSHIPEATPKYSETNAIIGEASTWGKGAYKAFNGRVFSFESSCTYTFCRHCVESGGDFNIEIKRNNDSEIEKITVIIDNNDVSIFGDILLVNGESVQIPYNNKLIHIKKYGEHNVLNSRRGILSLMWDKNNKLSLTLHKQYPTCGLCGNFNSTPGDDISEHIADSKIPGDCSKAVSKSYEVCEDGVQYCNKIIGTYFEKCGKVSTLSSDYKMICIDEYCQSRDKTSTCDTFSELSRLCASDGPGIFESWRNDPDVVCGYLLDDIGEKGRCVLKSDCPCESGGKVYQSGEVREGSCGSLCTCQEAKWSCTKTLCPGRCKIEGSLITTFDGVKYNHPGNCHFLAIHDKDWSISVELRPCPSGQSGTCLNSVTLLLNSSAQVDKYVFNRDGTVTNDKFGNQGYYYSDQIQIFNASSSYLQAETYFHGKMQIQIFPVMQLYVSVPPNQFTDTVGLCGSHNNRAEDDFMSSQNILEKTSQAFASSWEMMPCPKASTASCISIEKERFAERHCGILLDLTGPFASCHSIVDPKPYHEECKKYTCTCENSQDCLCTILGNYVKACAEKETSMVGWRTGLCDQSCPSGLVFKYNVKTCNSSCRSLSERDKSCDMEGIPVDGCTCPDEMYKNNEGNCVSKSQCDCYINDEVVQPGKLIHIDDNKCVCRDGILLCQTPIDLTLQNCSGGAEYVDCRNPKAQRRVDSTCSTRNIPTFDDNLPCKRGCYCPEGMVRNSKGNCVFPDDCPCSFGGREYDQGSVTSVGCNKCTCIKGSWNCTQNECQTTCHIYGDGHVRTFDGKSYSFDGLCQYALIEDYCGRENGTFRILTESVPCCEDGLTCSRKIIVAFQDQNIVLHDGKVTAVKTTESKECELNGNSYSVHTVGLYLILKFLNGITVIWDKNTRISVILDPRWNGQVCGLCGNNNGDLKDDFTTRYSSVAAGTLEFGNSWKTSQECSDTVAQTFPCDSNPYCKAWAVRKCEIIRDSTFRECHNKVDPSEYYDACIEEACACDMEGKYLGFCTAVAMYAEACSAVGVCVTWRKPDLCPVYCDYYNAPGEFSWHYEPCGTVTAKTCKDRVIGQKFSALLEGATTGTSERSSPGSKTGTTVAISGTTVAPGSSNTGATTSLGSGETTQGGIKIVTMGVTTGTTVAPGSSNTKATTPTEVRTTTEVGTATETTASRLNSDTTGSGIQRGTTRTSSGTTSSPGGFNAGTTGRASGTTVTPESSSTGNFGQPGGYLQIADSYILPDLISICHFMLTACYGPLGEKKSPGDTWTANCYKCTCTDAETVDCKLKECPSPPTCKPEERLVKFKDNDTCCEIGYCEPRTCFFNNNDYEVGASFADPNNPCISYSCHNTGFVAVVQDCPKQTWCAEEDRVYDSTKCCYTCKPNCRSSSVNVTVNYNGCKKKVKMARCTGECKKTIKYDYDLFQLKNSCLCCQEENYEYREIDLDCPDGGTIPYRYRHIITCSCLDICQQSTTSTVS